MYYVKVAKLKRYNIIMNNEFFNKNYTYNKSLKFKIKLLVSFYKSSKGIKIYTKII